MQEVIGSIPIFSTSGSFPRGVAARRASRSHPFFDMLAHKTARVERRSPAFAAPDSGVAGPAGSMSGRRGPSGPDGVHGESKLGRLVDALALGGDEGRDKLR